MKNTINRKTIELKNLIDEIQYMEFLEEIKTASNRIIKLIIEIQILEDFKDLDNE